VSADIEQAVAAVARRLGPLHPKVAIVLGSGLGHLADEFAIRCGCRTPRSPVFRNPASWVTKASWWPARWSKYRLSCKTAGSISTRACPEIAGLPVRVFSRLGVDTLIVTNAAGGIAPRSDRTLMLIADHVNLMFRNPLTGPVLDGEQRFPDMSDPYDPALRALAREVARERKIPLEEGVYVGLLGPSYETPAEIRMLQRLGVDAVGMSTVPEVIVARARGLRCVGFSTITNPAAGLSAAPLSHEDVLRVGKEVGDSLGRLVKGLVGRL
jgi:purine-nucleoside phosphorylase